LFRRNVACAVVAPLLKKISGCADTITGSIWMIAHENLDAAGGPFDCEGINYANAVSAAGDCAANPFSIGCDGHWRECLVPSDCTVFQDPEVESAAAELGCALGSEEGPTCKFASSPGLLFVSGRERDMTISVAQQLQRWHWLAKAKARGT